MTTREPAGRGERAENSGSVNWAFVPSMLLSSQPGPFPTVVKVGKAPRCGLPTDGVSRAAQVGWSPTLDQPLVLPRPLLTLPGPPRYRWRI